MADSLPFSRTERKDYTDEDGVRFRIVVTYGFDVAFAREHGQLPNFCATADIKRQARNERWMEHGGGRCDEEIALHFPGVAPLQPFNLCDSDGVPMHYTANARYWREMVDGKCKAEKWDRPNEALMHTVCYGAVLGDEGDECGDHDFGCGAPGSVALASFDRYLAARLPMIQEAMFTACDKAGIGVPVAADFARKGA